MAKLWMARFEIDMDLMCAQLFRTDRSDRAHDGRVETAAELLAHTVGFSRPDNVGDLVRGGEDHGAGPTRGDCRDRLAQRTTVGRQRPAIDRYSHDRGVARLESGHQVAVGNSIFLHRD